MQLWGWHEPRCREQHKGLPKVAKAMQSGPTTRGFQLGTGWGGAVLMVPGLGIT